MQTSSLGGSVAALALYVAPNFVPGGKSPWRSWSMAFWHAESRLELGFTLLGLFDFVNGANYERWDKK
jgi:hypothetical protein